MNKESIMGIGIVLLMAIIPVGLIAASGSGETQFIQGDTAVDSQVSPVGAEITDNRQYRFSEVNGSMLYGPYLVDGNRYFYQDGNVLDSSLDEVEKSKVERLHNFYLKTYLDPLFYSPQSGDMDLSGFERFEKGKVLTKNCGLEYDVIPQNYFDDLDKNHNTTDSFLNYASYENAEILIDQNIETTESYSNFVGGFIDLIDKEVSQNKCFEDDANNEGIALATDTPVQYRIDTGNLKSYVKMANENSRKLLEDIQNRRSLLESKNKFEIETSSTEIENITFSFNNTYNREEALSEFNTRRKSEVANLEDDGESGNESEEGEGEGGEEGEEGTEAGEESEEGEESGDSEESENSSEAFRSSDDNVTTEKTSFNLTDGQKESLRTVDELPVKYDMNPYCLERDTVPVYGWDRNAYPNMILGQDTLFKDNAEYLKDFFTSCRCPYVEVTRLKWYMTDNLYRNITEDKVSADYTGVDSQKVDRAERIFLKDPGENSMEQLSNVYDNTLRNSIKQGKFSNELPNMWKRNLQESSKLQVFESTYDDFYNEYHMQVWREYFPVDMDSKYSRLKYNYFLVSGTEYPLTFMTWSDSVWRLDKKPEKLSGTVGAPDLSQAAPGA